MESRCLCTLTLIQWTIVQSGCMSFMSAEELADARVTLDFIVAIQAVVLSCISLAI